MHPDAECLFKLEAVEKMINKVYPETICVARSVYFSNHVCKGGVCLYGRRNGYSTRCICSVGSDSSITVINTDVSCVHEQTLYKCELDATRPNVTKWPTGLICAY